MQREQVETPSQLPDRRVRLAGVIEISAESDPRIEVGLGTISKAIVGEGAASLRRQSRISHDAGDRYDQPSGSEGTSRAEADSISDAPDANALGRRMRHVGSASGVQVIEIPGREIHQ